jgi:hypothetical protein
MEHDPLRDATPSDKELMVRVRDGDPDAFEQIVLRHQAAW